jgi:hypothetical protein
MKAARLLHFFGIASSIFLVVFKEAHADDYDYVKEVLADEKDHYRNFNDPYNAKNDNAQETEQETAQQTQKAKLAAQAERKRQQRKEAFEKEIARMDAMQQKKARNKLKKDAKICKQILLAADNKNYYSVLGLRYMEIRINPHEFRLGKFGFTIPGYRLFHISDKLIKKAYRQRSRDVHPDRNRDSHAEEAFIALENAASVLLDPKSRNAYDDSLCKEMAKIRKDATNAASMIVEKSYRGTATIVTIIKRVLGPFAIPVLILGSIIL